MNAWFVSDIHIKEINERSSIQLLRFLSRIESRELPATHLFFLGDIFDLWISDAPVFIRKFQAFVDAVKRIRDLGIEVVFFEGNHDLYVKHFWQDQLHIPTFVEHHSFQLGSLTVRLEHGDLINTEDKAYARYRGVVRHRITEFLAPYLSGYVMNEIGQAASKWSRGRSQVQRKIDFEKLRLMIRDYAVDQAKSDHFDYLITGHMHIQDDFEFEQDGRKVRSVNLGSWFDGAKALHLTEQGSQFVSLD